ncbi:thiamine-phosphate kinase [Alsobacter sp. R-9]
MARASSASPSRPSEDDLIARHFAPLAGPAGLGLRDDAACLAMEAGHDLVLTADAVVAGVHFFPDDPADAIGWKALAVNLSDLAAKGADPVGFLLTLALPPDWDDPWLAAFSAGLGACARAGGCPLLGGDTVKTPGPLTLSITALGRVPAGRMVPRTGARPGDRLVVTGTIGDAALGLKLRLEPGLGWATGDHRAHLLDRYLRPQPRHALAAALRTHATAGMDVSDGLVGDLTKMMRVSGTSATVHLERVPLSPAALAAVSVEPKLLEAAVTGGDDYEVLAAVPPAAMADLMAEAGRQGVRLAEIGTVTPLAEEMNFLHKGRRVAFATGSFTHF